MKKNVMAAVCAAALATSPFAFSACGAKDEGAVNLVNVTAQEVGMRSDIDYYVVPEPAASTKVNAIEALSFSGDLQKLYGGEKGYPQAVVVAKSDFILSDGAFIDEFLNGLVESATKLNGGEFSAQTVVETIQAYMDKQTTTTLNAKALTPTVIKNCSVNFESAFGETPSDYKSGINQFMNDLNGVTETPFGTPEDGFFYDGASKTSSEKQDISVYMPDGAPALGLAYLMNVELSKSVDYTVVNAETIQTFVAGQSPQADICVLPVNLAVKLLGSGEKYKLLGTLTHGNLYMVSATGVEITTDNISGLKGKTVGVVNLAAVPGLTFKAILKKSEIEFTTAV